MKSANILLNAYLLICIALFTTGCIGWLIGKTEKQVTKEIDLNKDGELTPEEIKLSPYDTNKDGHLTEKEMQAAMAPHAAGDALVALLGLLNFPLAIGLKKAINVAKVHKENSFQLMGDIENIKDQMLDGEKWTRKKVTEVVKKGKRGYKNALHLTKMVKEYKGK